MMHIFTTYEQSRYISSYFRFILLTLDAELSVNVCRLIHKVTVGHSYETTIIGYQRSSCDSNSQLADG